MKHVADREEKLKGVHLGKNPEQTGERMLATLEKVERHTSDRARLKAFLEDLITDTRVAIASGDPAELVDLVDTFEANLEFALNLLEPVKGHK